jgi:dolichol kinase
MSTVISVPIAAPQDRRRLADRIFRIAVAVNLALTILALLAAFTGFGESLAGKFEFTAGTAWRLAIGIGFFNILWALIWYGIKNLLLRYFVGMNRDDRRKVFSSRMSEPFNLTELLARYSERRIRIADMIGRRGRFGIMALSGFFFFYLNVKDGDPNAFGGPFLRNNLLEAVLSSWLFIAFFYANNVVARAMYGPQSRVMDGVLARANCLLISTLWLAFKFVFVPIGATLGTMYPPHTFAAVFALIWGSYIVCDAAAEIVGSLWGKQQIRVWGLGDVNRKSIAGTVAGFTAALALGLVVVFTQGLPAPWIGLAVAIALSNTLLELYSPRGTDDFTMAVGNALVCLAFGALMY